MRISLPRGSRHDHWNQGTVTVRKFWVTNAEWWCSVWSRDSFNWMRKHTTWNSASQHTEYRISQYLYSGQRYKHWNNLMFTVPEIIPINQSVVLRNGCVENSSKSEDRRHISPTPSSNPASFLVRKKKKRKIVQKWGRNQYLADATAGHAMLPHPVFHAQNMNKTRKGKKRKLHPRKPNRQRQMCAHLVPTKARHENPIKEFTSNAPLPYPPAFSYFQEDQPLPSKQSLPKTE